MPDVDLAPGVTTWTPGPGVLRPADFARLGGQARPDAAAHGAGWAAGYAAAARHAARQAAVDAAVEAERVRAEQERAEQRRAQEHAAALAALETAARAVRAREEPVVEHLLDTVRHAALELAQVLLGAELSDASARARAALDRVLAVPDLPADLVVRLHPQDLDALPERPDGLALVADPALEPGDAVAEHADGSVDARLRSALDRVRAAWGEA
ncbi:MAG: hypothetical protein IR158_15650 [Cellulomonas sp.]|uniref:FliH/SctL family protein n=1 Tax=Cellulomonas sp. TaxID=40001 RepID=UPI0019EA7939|nr:FliH/SctL family protein [Cellulomonas sp.]MBF0689187.1 hypothetical protein [Cellulomonas sp.]